MAKQTFMARVKAYRKLHPRTSQVDAMKKLAGKKIAGVKRKVSAIPAKKKAVAGVKRAVTHKPVKRATTKTSSTYQRGMSIIKKIDKMEEQYKATKNKAAKKLLAVLINAEHDKLDLIQKRAKLKSA